MVEKDLIIAVIHKYEEAQNISGGLPGGQRGNLRRGTKHVISSFMEDIIGAFAADILGEDFEVWVDQSFRFNNGSSQFRPDVTLVKINNGEKQIIGFLEVKDSANPFRWNAEAAENRALTYITERTNRLQEYRGQELTYFDYETNGNLRISVHDQTKIDLVLFSDRLFSQEKLTALRHACDEDYLCLHILLRGYHPNCKSSNICAESLIEIIETDNTGEIYSEQTLRERLAIMQQMNQINPNQ